MEETLHRTHALPAAQVAVSSWRRFIVGAPAAWLVATTACVALAVVAVALPATSDGPEAPLLAPRAPASEVERAFSAIAPFSVQPNMGASGGKDATCSIYSDGDLDTGARVTWAVTLCTVHAIGAGPTG